MPMAAGGCAGSGARNSGLEDAIARSEGATADAAASRRASRPAAGALVEIERGVRQELATCAGRFGNAVNFRGEPHLPGIDLLTRYPGG